MEAAGYLFKKVIHFGRGSLARALAEHLVLGADATMPLFKGIVHDFLATCEQCLSVFGKVVVVFEGAPQAIPSRRLVT